MLLTFLIALLVVGLDQASKYLVVQNLKPVVDVPLIDGILHLHYVENAGAAFGILQNAKWLFVTISVLACLAIIGYQVIKRPKLHWVANLSLGLILGGAIGNNLIDRLRLGYIIDFIYVKAINFAIFNVADMGVTIGAVLLCVYVLFFHEKHTQKTIPDESEAPTVGPTED